MGLPRLSRLRRLLRADALNWSSAYRSCFQLASLYFFGLLGWRAWSRDVIDWSLVVVGALCWIFGHFGRLKSIELSLSGLKAEAEATVQKAATVVAELEKLATTLGSAMVAQITEAGRWGDGVSARDRDLRIEEILAALREIGVKEDEVLRIARSQDRWTIVDMIDWTSRIADRGRDPSSNVEWNAFWSGRNTLLTPISPEELEAFYRRIGRWDAELAEAVADYRHFRETSKIRRADHWARRDELQ